MVDGQVQLLEDGRQLELRRGDLVVAGLRWNAKAPQLVLGVGHEGQDAGGDAAEVVVLKLLVLRRRRAVEGAAGLQKVRALQVELLVNQEVFLLRAQCHGHRRLLKAKTLHQADDCPLQRLGRTQERGLLVKDLTCVGAEYRGDAEGRTVGMVLDEGGAGGIPGSVATGLEGAAKTAGREAGRVGLANGQGLARKLQNRLALGKLQEGVVLLGSAAGQRLEPVGVVGRTTGNRPLLHRSGNLVRNAGVQGLHAVDGRYQFLVGRLRKVLRHLRVVEDISGKEVQQLRTLRLRRFSATVGNLAHGIESLLHFSVSSSG